LYYIIYIIFIAIALYAYDPNEATKEARYAPLINETIPFYMDKFEKSVGENNGYFVNGKVPMLIILNIFTIRLTTKQNVFVKIFNII